MSVRKSQIQFNSSDGHSVCIGDIYEPLEKQPFCVVQIVHGMVEHFGRYETLANYFCERGYVVVGIDHIGHGRSVASRDEFGVYEHKTAAFNIVEDQHILTTLVKDKYPELPIIILGHSMGSFVVRCYIEKYGDDLASAIIMGTGVQSKLNLYAGRALTSLISIFHGWDYRSKFVDNMGCGSYNDEFENSGAKTGHEWLSRDENNCIAYAKDSMCGWLFSISGYYMISDLLLFAQNPANINKIPKDLPILVISGKKDPVGEQGRGPSACAHAFEQAGIHNVELKLIEGARHEILNEIDKAETYKYLGEWIEKQIN